MRRIRLPASLGILAILLCGCFRPAAETTAPEPAQTPEAAPFTVAENPGGLTFAGEWVTGRWTGTSEEPLQTLVSPDGSTAAYGKTDVSGEGGVFLRDETGKETQIFANVPLLIDNDSSRTRPLEDVIAARVQGYLDETHLVCTYSGYERSLGCGIYNIETGTWSEHRHNWSVAGIHDGAVYAWEVGDQYLPQAIWRIDADGTETRLAAPGENSHEVWEMLFSQTDVVSAPGFEGGMWILRPWEGKTQSAQMYFFSADAGTLLASLEWSLESSPSGYAVKDGNVTLFIRVEEEDPVQ